MQGTRSTGHVRWMRPPGHRTRERILVPARDDRTDGRGVLQGRPCSTVSSSPHLWQASSDEGVPTS